MLPDSASLMSCGATWGSVQEEECGWHGAWGAFGACGAEVGEGNRGEDLLLNDRALRVFWERLWLQGLGLGGWGHVGCGLGRTA